MKIICKSAKILFTVLCALFLLWGSISYADIVADNMNPNPQHYEWNMFVLMSDGE